MYKTELRKIYQGKRAALSDAAVESGSKAIADMLFRNFQFDIISSVHIFLPIKNKKEINTWYIIERLRKEYPSVKIVVPRIDETDFDSFLLSKETALKENSLGVPEPVKGIPFGHKQIDFVLLPLLVFDQSGNRIGYGKGFYDRFLTTCNPHVIKTGLSLFEAEECIAPDSFDIPLNFCVTPTKLYSF